MACEKPSKVNNRSKWISAKAGIDLSSFRNELSEKKDGMPHYGRIVMLAFAAHI